MKIHPGMDEDDDGQRIRRPNADSGSVGFRMKTLRACQIDALLARSERLHPSWKTCQG